MFGVEVLRMMFSVGMMAISFLISLVSFLITRFYIVNSAIVGFVTFLLTYKLGWEKSTYWILFFAVFIVSIVIQYMSKIGRIVYGVFACVVAAFIGYEWKADATTTSKMITVAVWVLIVGFLNVLSHVGIEGSKATVEIK